MDPNGTGYWHKVTDEFPRNITVLDAGSKLVDDKFEDVDVAKGIYNHHIAFFTMNKMPTPFATCGSNKATPGVPVSIFMGELIIISLFNTVNIATGGATEALHWRFTSEDGKFNSGFYLGPKAHVLNMIDIGNYMC